MIRSGIAITLTVLLCLGLNSVSVGQDSKKEFVSFEFSGESLSEALDQIIKRTEIDLVYDPKITEGIHIYERINPKNTDELLTQLLEDHELDYIILSSGTYVIVKSSRGGPFYGTFAGKVVDSETGEPLPGATVMLADASGGTSTNHSGNFSINKLLSGTHRITFSYVGYEPVSKTIQIRPDNELTERISLERKPVDVLPVVVEAHRAKIPHHQNPTMPVSSELNTVGVMRDAIRNLNLMSGIQYGLPLTDLHLQGGQQSEHRILLDGVPVYNPYSFGQMFSSFSPYAIGNVRVHKTGYGVQAGSQIAGLINLSHDLPATGNKSIVLQGDPLSTNLRGDLSFTTGEESSLQIMTALRTNFWDIYKNPTLENTLQDWNTIDPLITNAVGDIEYDAAAYEPIRHNSDIKFFDYHLATSYKIDNFSSISASLYLAENEVETRLLNQHRSNTGLSAAPYLYASDGYQWNNLTAQISWNEILTPRFDVSTQASYSINQFEHQNRMGTADYPISVGSSGRNFNLDSAFSENSTPLPTQFDGNEIQHFILKADGSYSISPHLLIEGGVQLDRVTSGIDISNLSYFPARIDQSATLLSSYLNTKHTFGSYWNVEWGSRFTYAALSNQVYAEPRFTVQFDQPESNIGYWSAKLSGGLYRQFINEFQVTNSGPTSLVPSFAIWSLANEDNIPKAWHLNGSALIEPSSNRSIKLELYYKWQPVTNITSYSNLSSQENLSVQNVQVSGIRAFAETTEMKAWGGGIKVNQSFADSNLKLKTGYDYSYSRIDMESQFGRMMPAPWNEPHRTQLRILWRMMPDLAVTAKWQGIWGRKWAFRKSYYDFLRYRQFEMPTNFSFNTPENDKMSSFQQVDLSFIYQPTLGSANLEVRLELLNILNRENTLEKYLQPVQNGEETIYRVRHRSLPGFHPTISLQVEF
ncbi:TonB-dependent receptor [Rhodohalobacter sulfatireducens]|uniref:Carboxypeptidase-like regulatory domain-containing protein n=1 Tax=Rhodohalobacter sulfatireducens TaxID=2911366 RepID=A0ABS9K9M0_9BACT|nr:carboxypeptidase-like regulatory domain-containing protein [Rhodohalobacter sulfatireducens]MCG2587536.1 carboxypeptidase-like regulatory domain-containing protein [Rhodohalobacter sulfatireducens]